MSEKKVRKYMLYALGEIILVVIGILIAFSINNWNEHRKLKTAEWQTIEALKAELTANIQSLENAQSFNKLTSDTTRLWLDNQLTASTDIDKARIIRIVAGFFPLSLNTSIMQQELGNNKKILFRPEVTSQLRSLEFTYQDLRGNISYLDEFWNGEFTNYMNRGGYMYSFASGYVSSVPLTAEFIGLYESISYKNIISTKGMLLLAVTWSQKAALDESKALLNQLNALEK